MADQPTLLELLVKASRYADNCDSPEDAARLRAAATRFRREMDMRQEVERRKKHSGCNHIVLKALEFVNGGPLPAPAAAPTTSDYIIREGNHVAVGTYAPLSPDFVPTGRASAATPTTPEWMRDRACGSHPERQCIGFDNGGTGGRCAFSCAIDNAATPTTGMEPGQRCTRIRHAGSHKFDQSTDADWRRLEREGKPVPTRCPHIEPAAPVSVQEACPSCGGKFRTLCAIDTCRDSWHRPTKGRGE